MNLDSSNEISESEYAVVNQDHPWPGLAAFREQDEHFFKGRETDIEELHNLVNRERLTILFGVSGLGKSSLLQAGLFPKLRLQYIFPINIRLNFSDDSEDLSDQIFSIIDHQIQANNVEAPEHFENETLWEYFHRKDSEFWNKRNQIVIPLLCFDQFEDLFTLAQDAPEKGSAIEKFIIELADLVEGRCPEKVKARLDENPDETKQFIFRRHPYKLIFSLREDYLADLEQLRSHIPSVIHNRMRLLQMNGIQALSVTDQTHGRLMQHNVAESIVRLVAANKDQQTQDLETLQIEPALLSLVCRELNELRISTKAKQIDIQTVESNREQILENFYQRCLQDQTEEIGLFIEDKLITVSGFRNIEAYDNALQTRGVTAQALTQLVQCRLLRLEERAGIKHIELIHDVITTVVRKKRDQRLVLKKQKQMEFERLEAEKRELAAKEELRISRRNTMISIFLSVIFIVTTVFSFWNWMDAKKSRRITLSGKLAADAALLTEQALKDNTIELAAALAVESWKVVSEINKSTISNKLLITTANKLVRMLPKFRIQHEGIVMSVAFSPDNSLLATASTDKVVRLINTSNGKELFRIKHDDTIYSIAFSPDNQYLATGSKDKSARLINTTNGEEVFHLVHEGKVGKVIISPDGQLLATASKNNARLINMKTGREIKQFSHDDEVRNLAFSPDSRILATASKDKMARLIDVSTGKETSRVLHDDWVNHLNFSLVGRLLATASKDNTSRLIDTTTGRETLKIRHSEPVWSVDFSPNGLWLATAGDDRMARVTDVKTGIQVAEISHNNGVFAVKFSPNGQFLATSSQDNTVRIIETTTWQDVTRIVHGGDVWNIAFSPDSQLLATASSDKIARLIETFNDKNQIKIRQNGAIYGVAFDPKGSFLATASADNSAKLYNISTGKIAMTIKHQDHVYGVIFSIDGQLIATSSKDKTAKLLNVTTGKEIATIIHTDEVRSIAFSPDNRWLTTVSLDKSVKVIDTTTGMEKHKIDTDDEIRFASFNFDGQLLAIANIDGLITLIDTKTWLTKQTFKIKAAVSHLAFSPDGKLLATASDDNTARIFNLSTGQEKAKFEHSNIVLSVAFSPDSNILATASMDRTALLINIKTNKIISSVKHGSSVNSIAFSSDGELLATGSEDGTTRLIETLSGMEINRIYHADKVWTVAFSTNNKLLASAVNDGQVHLINTAPAKVFNQLCGKAGRNLTKNELLDYLGISEFRQTCEQWSAPDEGYNDIK